MSRCGGPGFLENLILACIAGVRDFIKTRKGMGGLDERCCFYSIS